MTTPTTFKRQLLALALFGALGSTQAADYRYWYQPSDFGHQAGELTNGLAAIPAPAWACARRFFDGAQLQWIGVDDVPVGADNGGQDVYTSINVHFGTGAGCKPRPRMENHPAATVINPRAGAVYVVIDPDAGSYWVDKNGSWPACNCAAPVGFKAFTMDIRWSALARSMSLQLDRASGASGGHERWIPIESMSSPLAELQRVAASEIGKRRLKTLPTIETAVRQLEDQALASLARAATLLEQARQAQDRGATADAYLALDRARLAMTMAQRLLQIIVQEMR